MIEIYFKDMIIAFMKGKTVMQKLIKFFTIVELLIVITIVVILAGMLLPALKSARNTARTIACTSNLKQIGQAQTMYMNDSGGWLPPRWTSYPSTNYWYWALEDYLKLPEINKKGIFSCPGVSSTGGGEGTNDMYWYNVGYGYNIQCGAAQSGGANTYLAKYTDIVRPAKLIYAADTCTSYFDQWNSLGGNSTTRGSDCHIAYRHNNKCNSLFLDAHIETQKDIEKRTYKSN